MLSPFTGGLPPILTRQRRFELFRWSEDDLKRFCLLHEPALPGSTTALEVITTWRPRWHTQERIDLSAM
jgi:hypothetical protein